MRRCKECKEYKKTIGGYCKECFYKTPEMIKPSKEITDLTFKTIKVQTQKCCRIDCEKNATKHTILEFPNGKEQMFFVCDEHESELAFFLETLCSYD